MYYLERAAEALSQSGDCASAIFELPPLDIINWLYDASEDMENDFKLLMNLFKPGYKYESKIDRIIDVVIKGYLQERKHGKYPEFRFTTFKPLVYYALDYMRAYNRNIGTTDMPFGLNETMIKNKMYG